MSLKRQRVGVQVGLQVPGFGLEEGFGGGFVEGLGLARLGPGFSGLGM